MRTKAQSCRICGSPEISEVGEVEYFVGYAWSAYDCAACRCRFTRHDNSVYEALHSSGAIHYYSDYREIARQCKDLFDRADVNGLRNFLSRTSKYRFIIDE